jgi:hypothetical protein
LPQATESTAKSGEWEPGCSTMQAGPVAVGAQQPEPHLRIAGVEEGEQEGVGQGRKPQQFLPWFPLVDPRTLEGQLALLIFATQFDLPATHLGKDDLPGLLIGCDGFGREQIPGGAALTATDSQR